MLGGLAKNAVRLLVVGGIGAGLALAYRRLTKPADSPFSEAVRPLPEAPIPPQNIHDLLSILACPNCKSPLRLSDDEQELICDACRVAYQIEDGIPILLPDSGRPLDQPPGTSPSGTP